MKQVFGGFAGGGVVVASVDTATKKPRNNVRGLSK